MLLKTQIASHALQLFYHVTLALALLTALVMVLALVRRRRAGAIRYSGLDSRFSRSRRWLMFGLGGLWLLDGLLQAQPSMVTRFVGGFLAPLIVGQPGPVASLIQSGANIWAYSPPLFNAFATFVQIGIGLGLLFGTRRGQRAALWVSLAWGASVWIVGEGLGGILVGGGWLTGVPGSVLLYMGAAVMLLMGEQWWQGPRAGAWLRWGIVSVFALNGLLQALPQSGWWGLALDGYVQSMAEMPQPGLFSAPLYGTAQLIALNPALWNAVIIAGLAVAAAGVAFWPRNRGVLWFAIIWTFLGWWLGQDFGVLGGMGTDPNLGAILILGLLVYGGQQGVWRLPVFNGKAKEAA